MGLPEFAIHSLAVGGGTLAIAPMPGRTGIYGADWDRLLTWAPSLVVTMTTNTELAGHGAGSIGQDLASAGIGWCHLPTSDFGVPEGQVAADWPAVSARALRELKQGQRVLVHCLGGCGRSGMVALRLMIAAGEAPELAFARLRKVRPCAVETDAQKEWAFTGSSQT